MSPKQLDLTFAALSDPTRRAILSRLASGEASVTDPAKPFDMTVPAISKHLKVDAPRELVWKVWTVDMAKWSAPRDNTESQLAREEGVTADSCDSPPL